MKNIKIVEHIEFNCPLCKYHYDSQIGDTMAPTEVVFLSDNHNGVTYTHYTMKAMICPKCGVFVYKGYPSVISCQEPVVEQ